MFLGLHHARLGWRQWRKEREEQITWCLRISAFWPWDAYQVMHVVVYGWGRYRVFAKAQNILETISSHTLCSHEVHPLPWALAFLLQIVLNVVCTLAFWSLFFSWYLRLQDAYMCTSGCTNLKEHCSIDFWFGSSNRMFVLFTNFWHSMSKVFSLDIHFGP